MCERRAKGLGEQGEYALPFLPGSLAAERSCAGGSPAESVQWGRVVGVVVRALMGTGGAHLLKSGGGEMLVPRLDLEEQEESLCSRAATSPSFSAHVHLSEGKEGPARPDSATQWHSISAKRPFRSIGPGTMAPC